MKSLSVIIPNYNGADLLEKYLPSVIKSLNNYTGEWELIIVDDLSKDKSVEVLNKLTQENPKIKVLFNKVNLGFSGTCNTGFINSKGEIIFFLNNDVTLNEDFFNYFNAYFNSSDAFAVTVTGHLMSTGEMIDGAKFFEWKRGMPRITKNVFENDFNSFSIKRPFPSYAVQGAYFFAERTKLELLDGFDELFSPYLFEESDLSYRALKRGWKIFYEPRCIAYHAWSATISKKKKRHIRIISTKNKMIFTLKNISSKALLVSHIFFVILRLLSFNLIYWNATILTYRNRHNILKKRKIEIKESIITDKQIFNANPFN